MMIKIDKKEHEYIISNYEYYINVNIINAVGNNYIVNFNNDKCYYDLKDRILNDFMNLEKKKNDNNKYNRLFLDNLLKKLKY